MEVLGWVFLGVLALVALAMLMFFVASLPELRRYTEVRKM